MSSIIDEVRFDDRGLVPVIAQDAMTGRVLMLAWMDAEALERTLETGEAVYWSRSRRRLWRKGEESGHLQKVREIRLDCDGDVVLLTVEQIGAIACHTGRESCFYRRWQANNRWTVVDDVVVDPATIYKKD